MLRELRINGFAVMAHACMQPGDGFSVLTGETGAGKSVCVNALRAVLGGRIDADVVRPGESSARIAAVFDDVPEPLRTRLDELSIAGDDMLTLSREIVPGGRGACRINGALVSMALLREFGERLADVTVQGASQRLLRPAWQRELVDAATGTAGRAALDRVAHAVRAWKAAITAREAARAALHSSTLALQQARDVIAELGALDLRPDEEHSLTAEVQRLRNAARLISAGEALATAAGEDETGAADSLAAAVESASASAAIDPPLRDLVDEAALLVERLRDLALGARRYAGSVLLDEDRLAEVEARLDTVARVVRRHGSIDAAMTELERARAIVDASDGGEGLLAERETAVTAAAAGAAAAAAELSRVRATASRRLERDVSARLRSIELPHARFRIVLSRAADPAGLDAGDGQLVACDEHGVDDVEFRLVTNPDMLPAALDRGPSGGELSRLALALSAAVTDTTAPLLVLDEVDTGIGGETAARVGDLLAEIGAGRQVLAVTHRPEIAARAGTHLLVQKREVGGTVTAEVATVTGDVRVREIARLMSGRHTDAALRRATELLQEGAVSASPEARLAARTM